MTAECELLACKYRDVLAELPPHWIDRSRASGAEFNALSDFFLPGTSEAYLSAPQRIMVIGRETKGWRYINKGAPYINLDDYIQRGMKQQQDSLAELIADKHDRGLSYFNLLRDIALNHGREGIAWANLFSCSWKKKSPSKWEHFSTLLDVSKRLLKIQIEVLKPDIIIFANGVTSRALQKSFFPNKGEDSVCSQHVNFKDQGFSIAQLWQFDLDERIRCYRIHHPSSSSTDARNARAYLLDQLLPKHFSHTKERGRDLSIGTCRG